MDALAKENARLKRKICALEKQLQICNQELDKLRSKPSPFKRGHAGEKYVADLLGCEPTAPNARHDILTKTGKRLEIKLSGLNGPNSKAKTKRWRWVDLFGKDGKKDYDRLILLGEVDPEYRDYYAEKKGPYVIFDIPYSHAVKLSKGKKLLELVTNPNPKKHLVSCELFHIYQKRESKLISRYNPNL